MNTIEKEILQEMMMLENVLSDMYSKAKSYISPTPQVKPRSTQFSLKPMPGGNKVSDGKGGWINLPDGAKPWEHSSTKHMYDSHGKAKPMSQIQQPSTPQPIPPSDRNSALQTRINLMKQKADQVRANAQKVPVTSDVTNGNTRTITRSGYIKPSPESAADGEDMLNSRIVK